MADPDLKLADKPLPADVAEGLEPATELLLKMINDSVEHSDEARVSLPICRQTAIDCRIAEIKFMGNLSTVLSLAEEPWEEGDEVAVDYDQSGLRILHTTGADGQLEALGYQKNWGEPLVMITHPDGVRIGDKLIARPGSLVCIATEEKAPKGQITTLPIERVLGMRFMRLSGIALAPEYRQPFKDAPSEIDARHPTYTEMSFTLTIAKIHEILSKILANRRAVGQEPSPAE